MARASRGQVMARVLSANPAEPWPQPPWRRRTTGARISLLVSGSVWFYLAGTGEESFSAKDSWYLPPGFDYALLEASSDFELLEIELPASAGSQVGGLTIPEVLMLYATYSYRSVRCFGGLDDEAHASAEAGDPDAGPSLKLDDGAPTRWAGCPWHLREQGLQCGYLTRGTARIEVDGAGVVDAQPGTFWLQQAQIAPRLLRTPQHDKDAKSQRSTGTGSAGAAVSDYW